VELTLAQVLPGQGFVDEAVFGGIVLRTAHTVEAVGEGSRITYRMEITGDGADQVGPEIGPGITADWPETMTALARRAEGR
jgi:hypothetical protein